MNLNVLVPGGILLSRESRKISGEAINGAFTLLPRHLDFVTILRPGLLYFITGDREEIFVAVDRGVLLKTGTDVQVSVRDAVKAGGLEEVRETVRQRYRKLDENQRKSRTALARMESEFIRRFLELEKNV